MSRKRFEYASKEVEKAFHSDENEVFRTNFFRKNDLNWADLKCYKILNYFSIIESNLSRLILHSLGADNQINDWDENYINYISEFSKIFPVSERIEIIDFLVKKSYLNENSESDVKDIRFPTGFKIKKKKSRGYLNALRIAFEYRNIIAHEGYSPIIFRAENGEFTAIPVIKARKYQYEKGCNHIDLRVVSSLPLKEEIYDFHDFILNLSDGFPFGMNFCNPRYSYSDIKNNAKEELLTKRKSILKEFTDTLYERKVKNINSFFSKFDA